MILNLVTMMMGTVSPSEPPLETRLPSQSMEKTLPLFETKLLQGMKERNIPGVAVAIVSRDHILSQKTFGVQQLGKTGQIKPTTLFQVASLSKPISSTLLAVLKEKGKLSFQDGVNRLIPSFQNSISSNPIKISHLLSHSSGLSGEGVDDLIESGLSREKIIAQIREKVDEADPGKMFSYHNVAYGLIGDLIETTSGYSFEEALKHLLATPLNMNAIGIGFDALMKNEDRAHPHVQHEKDTFVSATQYSTAYYAFPSSAGVHASLEDLTAFLQLYLGKYSHILSAESIQELTTPRIEASHLKSWYPSSHKDKIGEIAYGFGWQLMTFSQRKLICHGGWLDGFVSFLAFMPERDVGIVILTNAECDFASELGLDFFDMLCSY